MHYEGANLRLNWVKIGDTVNGFWPQRKGSFVSGSGRLCQISSKLVQNCDCESTDRQTHRQTHANTHRDHTSDLIICPMLCYSNGTDNKQPIAPSRIVTFLVANTIDCLALDCFFSTSADRQLFRTTERKRWLNCMVDCSSVISVHGVRYASCQTFKGYGRRSVWTLKVRKLEYSFLLPILSKYREIGQHTQAFRRLSCTTVH